MTTGKIIALTRQTFVGKVMSLFFNTLSRFVIAFLPRSEHLLVSWLQSPSTVIFESKKIKSVTVCIVSASICHEVMGLDAIILVFCMLHFKPEFNSWVREDLLEKKMATHSNILAWKIPWTEEPSRLQSMGSQRVGHD